MSRRPIPIVGDSYADDPHGFSAQETINWRPVRTQRGGTRSEWRLETPAGLFTVGTVGEGPSRGAHDFEGRHFRVSRRTLYEVKADGSVHDRGTIPGVGRVSLTHNANGQLVIGTGTSGYVYDITTETLTQISDDGFPGFLQCEFNGQYVLGVEPQGRFWFHSALNDATSYNTNDRYVDETLPDRLRGLVSVHSQVLVLGERTGSVYVNEPVLNEGVVTASYQRASGIVIERGLGGTHSLCKIGGAAYWVGDDGRGYRWAGNQPEPITTDLVEKAWQGLNLRTAFSMGYEDRGVSIWYVTFTDGQTWAYDIGQQLWHRRSSDGIERWRVNDLVKWNRAWYAGDYNGPNLYLVDWGFVGEGDDPLISERISGVAHAEGDRLFWDELEIQFADDVASVEPEYTELWVAIVVSPPIPDYGIGEVVSWQYVQTGGIGDIVWSFTGELPDGLTLDPDTGLLAGTITANPPWDWVVIATDSLDHSGSLVENIPLATLEITGSLPDTLDSVAYEERLTIVGGVPPYLNATISAGALPTTGTVAIVGDELVFEWEAGQTPDLYEFTVQVEDSAAQEATSPQTVELFQAYGIYVGHNSTASAAVTVIDPDTNTITDTLGAGSGCKYPQPSTDGTMLVGKGQLYLEKVVIATGVATTLEGAGAGVEHFIGLVNDTHAFGLQFSPERLDKLLLSDGSLVTNYTPTGDCAGMCWNADRSKIYLARYTLTGYLTFTVATGAFTVYSEGGNAARGIAVRASDNHVFRSGQINNGSGGYGVTHYDADGTVLGVLQLDATEQMHIPAISPDGKEYWVTNYDTVAGRLFMVNIEGDTPVLIDSPIAMGTRPDVVNFSPDGVTAYVTNPGSDNVKVIDVATRTVTATIAVDDLPSGVTTITN